jgi:hypothetical protein
MPALYDSIRNDGAQSDVLMDGLDVETLTMTVPLAQKGSTLDQVDQAYIVPLKAMLGGTITVSTPLTSINGTWGFADLTPDYDSELGAQFSCSLKFIRGAATEEL